MGKYHQYRKFGAKRGAFDDVDQKPVLSEKFKDQLFIPGV
jgi:hypothetical protein